MKSLRTIAWRNVRKNWRHSLASMSAIATGYVAICTFQGFIQDASLIFEDAVSRMAMQGDVLIQRKGAAEHFKEDPTGYSMDLNEQSFVEKFLEKEKNQVQERVRFVSLVGMISTGMVNTVFIANGYDIEAGARVRGATWEWNTVRGKPLHLQNSTSTILMAEPLARMLGCEATTDEDGLSEIQGYVAKERPFRCVSDRVQLQATTDGGRMNAIEATIGGMSNSGLREMDDKYTVMPLQLAQELLGSDRISSYAVQLAPPARASDFATRFTEEARRANFQLEAMLWQDHPVTGEMFRRSIELLSMFQFFVMAVVLLIGSMAVVNTMIRSVAERTREIGTLRALGFRRKHVLELFAWEGVFLSLLACGVGFVGSLGVSLGVRLAELTYPKGIASYTMPLRIQWVPPTYVLTMMGLVLLAVFAAFYASRRAARQKIPDALGHL